MHPPSIAGQIRVLGTEMRVSLLQGQDARSHRIGPGIRDVVMKSRLRNRIPIPLAIDHV